MKITGIVFDDLWRRALEQTGLYPAASLNEVLLALVEISEKQQQERIKKQLNL